VDSGKRVQQRGLQTCFLNTKATLWSSRPGRSLYKCWQAKTNFKNRL